MKNETLISILEQLKPDDELCVEISECISGKFLDLTYAIGYDLKCPRFWQFQALTWSAYRSFGQLPNLAICTPSFTTPC